MSSSVLVAGARTPIGRLLGGLKGFSAAELGGVAIRAALERAGVTPEQVEFVVMGQVLQAGAGQIPARQAAVAAGVPMSVPALTVNKVCLSGINAIAIADQMIRCGDADIVVAGGMESMTNAPHYLPGSREGFKYGDVSMVDSMAHDGLWDAFTDQAMGLLTERCNAEDFSISREEQDAYSARSHQRAAMAWKNGVFDDEVVPVEVAQPARRPDVRDDRRGHPRGHHDRLARPAASCLRQGGHDHRRLRVPDLRRCVRGGHDEPGQGGGARTHLARRGRGLRHRGGS
jgi:acetyl-CoA C-acetyltransferase